MSFVEEASLQLLIRGVAPTPESAVSLATGIQRAIAGIERRRAHRAPIRDHLELEGHESDEEVDARARRLARAIMRRLGLGADASLEELEATLWERFLATECDGPVLLDCLCMWFLGANSDRRSDPAE